MPKVFKNQDERDAANNARVEKQKYHNRCIHHDKRLKEELNSPHCHHTFCKNFMKEATGNEKYSNKNFLKHIGYCELVDFYDALAPIEYCICGHKIRYVFICHYNNPKNNKEFIFNVGSSCIENTENDKLKLKRNLFIGDYRRDKYTCKYCKQVCLHDTGRAHDLFDITISKCKECQKKPWCEYCKENLKIKHYFPKCVECWSKGLS